LTDKLPDLQAGTDHRGIDIDKVGVTNVRYPLQIPLKDGENFYTVANLSMTVRVRHVEIGTHMSRFMQCLNSTAWKFTPYSVHQVLSDLRERLKSSYAHIKMEFPIFLDRIAPVSGEIGIMDYDCYYEEEQCTDDDQTLSLRVTGVKVNVTTLCPCSKHISDRGAHNQRSEILIRVWPIGDEIVWFEDLIEIAEAAASCPLYPVLKRTDEKYVTEKAYDNPRFVEDVVRELALNIEERLQGQIVMYFVSSTNRESIHNHDAYAEICRLVEYKGS
jgi:GTP cyclohydrolase I